MSEILKKSLFVSASGGSIDFVSPEGEILASLAVPAGLVPAAPYLALVPFGAELQVASGLAVLNPPSAAGIQPYGRGSHESGANPDFRPLGTAEKLQKELRHTMRHMQASTKRLEARENALSLIERIPSPKPAVPAPDPAPVASPAPEPAPVVSPEPAAKAK